MWFQKHVAEMTSHLQESQDLVDSLDMQLMKSQEQVAVLEAQLQESRDRFSGLTSDPASDVTCIDGELFIEKRQTESLGFDDGKLKSSSIDDTQGFGLRAVTGETAAYAHATELSTHALKRATSTALGSISTPRT